jgi:hypothetical protein
LHWNTIIAKNRTQWWFKKRWLELVNDPAFLQSDVKTQPKAVAKVKASLKKYTLAEIGSLRVLVPPFS